MRRCLDQVRLTGPLGVCGESPHWPLTVDVTFGGLPAPCDTICVVRVQVAPPLLTDTTVVLLLSPAGMSPNEAI
jgi:hypothetical protein